MDFLQSLPTWFYLMVYYVIGVVFNVQVVFFYKELIEQNPKLKESVEQAKAEWGMNDTWIKTLIVVFGLIRAPLWPITVLSGIKK